MPMTAEDILRLHELAHRYQEETGASHQAALDFIAEDVYGFPNFFLAVESSSPHDLPSL